MASALASSQAGQLFALSNKSVVLPVRSEHSLTPPGSRTQKGMLQIWSAEPFEPSGRNLSCSRCNVGAPLPHVILTETVGMPDWFRNVENGFEMSFFHSALSEAKKSSAVVARHEYRRMYASTPF